MRECGEEKERACALRLCFSADFCLLASWDRGVAAGFFDCDCRKLLDKEQGAVIFPFLGLLFVVVGRVRGNVLRRCSSE